MEELRATVASTAERSEAVNARFGRAPRPGGATQRRPRTHIQAPGCLRTPAQNAHVSRPRRGGVGGALLRRRRAPFAQIRRRGRVRGGEARKRTPPPPTRRIRYDARSRTPPTPRSDEETHARRQERGRSPRRRTTERRRRTIRRRRTTRRRRPRTRTPAVTSVSSDLSASECVELLELLGTPRGALHGEYLSSRRPQLEASVRRLSLARASPSPSRIPIGIGILRRVVVVSFFVRRFVSRGFRRDGGGVPRTLPGRSRAARFPGEGTLRAIFRRRETRARLRRRRRVSAAAARDARAIVGVHDGKNRGDPSRVSRGGTGRSRGGGGGACDSRARGRRLHRARGETRERARRRRRRREEGRRPHATAAVAAAFSRNVLSVHSPAIRGAQRRAAHRGERTRWRTSARFWRNARRWWLRGARNSNAPFARGSRRCSTRSSHDSPRTPRDRRRPRRADERENVPAGTSPLARAAMGSSSSSSTPARLLSRARLAAFLATDGAAHVARAVDSHFPDTDAVGDGTGGSFDAERCSVRSAAASSALASAYVAATGGRLSLMIRRSMQTTDWLDAKEPRDVRPLADFLPDDLAAVEAETAQILEDGGEPGRGSGPGPGPGPGSDAALRRARRREIGRAPRHREGRRGRFRRRAARTRRRGVRRPEARRRRPCWRR